MTAPEFTPLHATTFEEHQQEYYTVQHKVSAGDGWHREIPPLRSPEEAVAALEAHAHWYEPGHIRAVKKVVRTIVQVETVELSGVELTRAQLTGAELAGAELRIAS